MATSSPRSPSLSAYHAALNLLGARALFSNITVAELLDPAMKAKKSAVERHHLFPKAYLEKLGITEVRETNQIANYALVEWADNIEISDTAPAKYLPAYEARFRHEDLTQMYYWHALPQGWQHMRYAEFLEERRRRMAEVIRDAFALLSSGKASVPDSPTMYQPQLPIDDKSRDTEPGDEGLALRHILRREFWRAFMERGAGWTPLPGKLGTGTRSYIEAQTGKRRLY